MNQMELYQLGKNILKKENVEDSEKKAKKLLEFVLKISKEEYIRNSLDEVSILKKKEYETLLNKIIQGKPLQYIINKQEFMGITFYVDENVLIPQPDTEILVEQAIKLIEKNTPVKILDLCTGSGAIAVSIAKYIKNDYMQIVASDISKKALAVAQKNAIQNEVENKIKFVESDMFSNLENSSFDIIISNPPYIKTKVIQTLSKEVKNEPKIALDGGMDGLDFYRIILQQAQKYLKPNGYVLFEIGYDQGEEILNLWNNLAEKEKCKLQLLTKNPIKDFSENDRVMIFKMC